MRSPTHRSLDLPQPLRKEELRRARRQRCVCRGALLCLYQAVGVGSLQAARQPRPQPRHVRHVRTRCRCASVRILPRLATCCCFSSCSASSAFSGLDAERADSCSAHAQHPHAAHACVRLRVHAPREAFCRVARQGQARSVLQALAGFGSESAVRPLRHPAGASRHSLALAAPRGQRKGIGLQRSTVHARAIPVQRLVRGIALPARKPRRVPHTGEGRRTRSELEHRLKRKNTVVH